MKDIHILLVEDNEGDIVLTTEAFEDSKFINEIMIARNGKEALDCVYQRESFSDSPLPDLILLDINLPLKNGHEVLQIIKNDDELKHIPVIMLTTSSAERDIQLSYQHNANSYISKPVDISNFMKAISSIENFWLQIVTLPPKT